jgi:DNA-binding MarR family transcriptional regulator
MLYRRRDCYYERELDPYNIGPGQYRILLGLLWHMPENNELDVSQKTMADHLGLDKGAVTRSMKKLEKEGYIMRKRSIEDNSMRKRSKEDNRKLCISLTDKAYGLKEELVEIRRRWTRILGEGFSEKEKSLAVEILEKMAGNADRYLCSCRNKKPVKA